MSVQLSTATSLTCVSIHVMAKKLADHTFQCDFCTDVVFSRS